MQLRSTQLLVLLLVNFILSSANAQNRFNSNDAMRDRLSTSGYQSDWLRGGSFSGGYLGGTTSPQEWRLGVTVSNTPTGVVINNVTPNSAGARAGFEVGDSIVTVGGYQVGMIDGRLYDMGEELRRRADASGIVSLLVQDHLSGRLETVRVQLDSNQSVVNGELVYRERFPLPADAVVTVQIENVTRPFAQVRGGQISFRPPAGNLIPFEISYDPTYIYPQDIYQVRAYVTSGGRTIWDTVQPQRVLTQNNPTRVQLTLVSTVQNVASNPSTVTAGYPNFNVLDDQIIKLYQQYLGRSPTNLELAALRSNPGILGQMPTLPVQMMATQEYFDAAGNNNQLWLQKVFGVIVGKQPSAAELDQWMQRYAQLGYSRTELLRQLNQQAQTRR